MATSKYNAHINNNIIRHESNISKMRQASCGGKRKNMKANSRRLASAARATASDGNAAA